MVGRPSGNGKLGKTIENRPNQTPSNTLWAHRRRKAEQGHGKQLLHGPVPKTVWLNAETRELMEELNKMAANPRLEKSYRFS
jgi:hypothetical protein